MSRLKPSEGTKKIGIKFSDNDFYYTFTAFLRFLLPDETYTHHMAQTIKYTKKQVADLFNVMALGIYLVKQNAWRYGDANSFLHTQEYLKIKESDVMLDDEVDKFIADNPNGCNSEAFFVDFTEAYIWTI